MNEMERVEAYFKGEEVDCIPFGLMDLQYAIANNNGYTIKEYNSDIDIMTDVYRYKRDEYGFYEISVGLGSNLKGLGEALGSKLYYPEDGYEYVVDFILDDYNNLEDLETVNIRESPTLNNLLSNGRILKERLPDMYLSTSVAGPITTAASVRQIERLLRDTRKNSEKLHRLLSILTDLNLEWIKMFKEEFGSCDVSIADPVSCQDMLNIEQYKEFSFPYQERLVNGIKDIMGVKPLLHICGHTYKFLEEIKKLDLSIFSVDNCEDIKDTVDLLGDKFTIIGNVDPVSIIRNGSREDIFEECKITLEKGAESPNGFMLFSGCEIPMGTSHDNLKAFIEAAKILGKGAQIGKKPKGLYNKVN